MLTSRTYSSPEWSTTYYEGGNIRSDTLVLSLHGWSGKAINFGFIADLVPEYHFVAPELPFHARGGNISDPTLAGISRATEGLTKSVPHERVFIFGHSVGGTVGLKVASFGNLEVAGVVASDPYANPLFKGIVRKTFDAFLDNEYDSRQQKLAGTNAPRELHRIVPSLNFWKIGARINPTIDDLPRRIKPLILFGLQDRVVTPNEWFLSTRGYSQDFLPYDGGHFWYKWQMPALLGILRCSFLR